jgi:hypothetical protein
MSLALGLTRPKSLSPKATELIIRAKTNAPDAWLDLNGEDLSRRLVTTGSQCRSVAFDVLGRQSVTGLNAQWAASEKWKQLDSVTTTRPRNRLRHLSDLLAPHIEKERLKIQVKGTEGSWIPLVDAAKQPTLVVRNRRASVPKPDEQASRRPGLPPPRR